VAGGAGGAESLRRGEAEAGAGCMVDDGDKGGSCAVDDVAEEREVKARARGRRRRTRVAQSRRVTRY
jgi:hypothetical protein